MTGTQNMGAPMSDLYSTGVRPYIDKYMLDKAAEKRDYGIYWSASSAGYCMRKVIFDRLGVPPVEEDARKERIFESGHVFHEWIQRVTRNAGISIAQELELQDEKYFIRGHIDDLAVVGEAVMLIDYKTQNSRAFQWQKKLGKGLSHYHKMQLGTYMYLLRKVDALAIEGAHEWPEHTPGNIIDLLHDLKEARIIRISKDDLCMSEDELLWTPALAKQVAEYWGSLNSYWDRKQIPRCTCAEFEVNDKTGVGFMADKRYNPYYYAGEPCSLKWLEKHKELLLKWKEA